MVSTGGHTPDWPSSSLDKGGMPASELGPAHVPVPSWLYTRQVMFALDSLFTCNKEQILTDAPPPHLLYHLQETGFPSNSPVSSPRQSEGEKDRQTDTGAQPMKRDHLSGGESFLLVVFCKLAI